MIYVIRNTKIMSLQEWWRCPFRKQGPPRM